VLQIDYILTVCAQARESLSDPAAEQGSSCHHGLTPWSCLAWTGVMRALVALSLLGLAASFLVPVPPRLVRQPVCALASAKGEAAQDDPASYNGKVSPLVGRSVELFETEDR
jgi:hypothetical protein